MGCVPSGDRRTYDPSIVRQRQTEGDTPLPGGGKTSTSLQGCQSAVGREVTWMATKKKAAKKAKKGGKKKK
jgi:hypothetical protein